MALLFLVSSCRGSHSISLLLLFLVLSMTVSVNTAWAPPISTNLLSAVSLHAKPRRLEENVEGPLFVNDRCINCAACSNFAPASFAREEQQDTYHYVHRQPQTKEEMDQARAALAACPVAAIRLETKAERQHRAQTGDNVMWTLDDEQVVQGVRLGGRRDGTAQAPPFPRRFLGNDDDDVYWLGHHNEKSFGATLYLLRATWQGQFIWIMVDTPKYGISAQRAIEFLTGPKGPDYLFLTHVDDTADHQKWANHYNKLQRIFHAGDLGIHNWIGDQTLEDVEILLPDTASGLDNVLTAYTLDGQELPNDWAQTYSEELVILHTPGHSPGSITLYRRPSSLDKNRPGILFTGDSYAWSTRYGGRMSGMGLFGNDLPRQAKTLERLLDLDWELIAPGHSHPRDYRDIASPTERMAVRKQELDTAVEDLLSLRL